MRIHPAVPGLVLLLCSACDREDSPPPNRGELPGSAKEPSTKVLEKGAEALQEFAPVQAFDHYLDGFHVMKDDPSHHMEAHHYCKALNEDLTQCAIFDANTKDANLIGIEYILSEALFETLPAEERQYWHPHNYEILSGQLVLPGVPEVAEKAALKKKMNSYGKTWHIWDTGHSGARAASKLPVGIPMLAWSYNYDGEALPGLVETRDKRMNIDTTAKRKAREELVPLAHPQEGVDALKGKLKNAGTTTPGVTAKPGASPSPTP
jgi:hypothetical protein